MSRRSAGSMIRILAATVVGVLPVFLVGGLSVLMSRDLPLDEQRLGLVAASFWASSALFSWPAGRLADRFGAPAALVAGTLCAAAAAGGVAVSTSTAAVAAAMAVGGVGNALVVPGGNLAVARSMAPTRQGTAFGLKQAALSSGVLLAGLALPLAVAGGGWRATFAAAAVLAVVCAATMIGWKTPAAAPGTNAGGGGESSRRGMLVLGVAAGMASATNTILTTFFVASAVEGGRDAAAAGVLLSIGSALGIAARLAVGGRADRTAGLGLREIAVLLVVGAPGFALLAWPGATVPLVVGTVVAFGAGWGWTGLYHLAIVRLRPRAPATASGAAAAALFLGSIVGPWGFGTLASTTSFTSAWLAAGLWLLLAGLAVQWARRLLDDVPA